MKGNKANPYTLELNPTNNCNLRCRFCWQRNADPNKKEELSYEKIMETVEEASELGVEEFRIPGSGEPLMRRSLVEEMIEKIKKEKMHGLLISNGSLLDTDILERMVSLEWDILTISIDSADARNHDLLRDKVGTFQKVIANLNELKELKEEYGSDKPKLRFNTVLTNLNYNHMAELVEIAHRLGCEDIQVQPMTVFSEIGEKYKLKGHKTELNKSLTEAKTLADKYDIYTNMDSFIDNEIVDKTEEMDRVIEEEASKEENRFLSAPCFEPWYNMVILPQGEVAQCSMFGGKGGDNIGNKSLKEVWFGDYFEKARRRLLDHELFSYCKNCCVPVNLENKRIRENLRKD